MAELEAPPGHEVIWLGRRLWDEHPSCAVRAQTWFEARKKVSIALGVEPGHADVRRAAGDEEYGHV